MFKNKTKALSMLDKNLNQKNGAVMVMSLMRNIGKIPLLEY